MPVRSGSGRQTESSCRQQRRHPPNHIAATTPPFDRQSIPPPLHPTVTHSTKIGASMGIQRTAPRPVIPQHEGDAGAPVLAATAESVGAIAQNTAELDSLHHCGSMPPTRPTAPEVGNGPLIRRAAQLDPLESLDQTLSCLQHSSTVDRRQAPETAPHVQDTDN